MSSEKNTIVEFIKYNNAVPIILGILFLSTGVTMAASPTVRDAVYKTESQVQSIDNSYLLSVNLATYPFSMRITRITQDDEYYYLEYDFNTIEIHDSAWKDVIHKSTLRLSKSLLRGGDLEAYAESELAQVREHEMQRLKETQSYEKRLGTTPKTVATIYTGLIGSLIKPTEETAPFYVPPPGLIDLHDPLNAPNALPSLTWDANAEPEEIPVREEEEQTGGHNNEPAPPPTDVCPDIEGIQINPSDCAQTEFPPPVVEEPAQEEETETVPPEEVSPEEESSPDTSEPPPQP
jgi:hypothetical protein